MAVLNLAWTHLTKLLLAVPAAARQQVLQPAAALSGFQCALQQLQRAVQDMPQQAPEKREVVARFWMQNVIRLMQGVISGEVVQAALVSLLEVTTEVYQRGMFPGCAGGSHAWLVISKAGTLGGYKHVWDVKLKRFNLQPELAAGFLLLAQGHWSVLWVSISCGMLAHGGT